METPSVSIPAKNTIDSSTAVHVHTGVRLGHMDPKEVLSGKGAALYGGRFASLGPRAVYLAESDSDASREVLARKQRLGGNAQITLDKYPRIVFAVSVSLERVLDFTKRGVKGGVKETSVAEQKGATLGLEVVEDWGGEGHWSVAEEAFAPARRVG